MVVVHEVGVKLFVWKSAPLYLLSAFILSSLSAFVCPPFFFYFSFGLCGPCVRAALIAIRGKRVPLIKKGKLIFPHLI